VNPALYLIDTSGLFRILQDKLRQAWADQLAAGVIATCPVVELEFLYSARSLADRLEKRRLLREVFGRVALSDRAYQRADEVQQLLTETARHRSAGPVDLLIAATAERAGLIVLGDDRDFQTVASVTGQPVKLVADHVAVPGHKAGTAWRLRPATVISQHRQARTPPRWLREVVVQEQAGAPGQASPQSARIT